MTASLAVRSNEEAEEFVVAAMMENPAIVALALDRKLLAVEFVRKQNRMLFAEIIRLNSRDEPTSYASLVESFEGRGELDDVGGKSYLSLLPAKRPPAGHEQRYIDTVKAAARDRRRGEVLNLLQAPGLNGDGPSLVAELSTLVGDTSVAEQVDRWSDGASFILDGADHVGAVWGRDGEVLHPDGEPLLLVSQPGAGKTTLAQQYALRLAGVIDGELLQLPVKPVLGKVVYVAADRPSQAARSFSRMVGESDRDALAACLDVWRGPLPFDFAADPHLLYPFLRERGAGAVFIDSLGATAYDLASDEAGSRIFAAMSEVTAEGIQVVVLHHDRKRDQNSDKARTLDDVYGSRWITAAAGSVLYLDGKPGDVVMSVRHLKQPVDEIGPLTIKHNHEAGRTVIFEKADLLELAVAGITVKQAASTLFDTAEPDRNEVEKARRRLVRLAEAGKLNRSTDGGGATVYTAEVTW